MDVEDHRKLIRWDNW